MHFRRSHKKPILKGIANVRKTKSGRKCKEAKRNTPTKRPNSKEKDPNKKSNEKNRKQGEITVEKSRLFCRAYEEFHDHFLTYEQIEAFLAKIRKNYPGAVDIITMGHSAQGFFKGRSIYLVLITMDASSSNHTKFATFIEAGMKGEDVFAVSNAIYMIDYLCKNQSYIRIMDYFIAPCGNPDAYDQYVKSRAENKQGVDNNKKDPCALNKRRNSDTGKADGDLAKRPRLQCPKEPVADVCKKNSSEKKEACKKADKNQTQPNKNAKSKGNCDTTNKERAKTAKGPVYMDLSFNFPVLLGMNDMRIIPTDMFLDKIKIWKENFIRSSPEALALVRAINGCVFAVKLLISLREGGESICYPFGFSGAISNETTDLKLVAKKGKSAITGRNFQYGSLYDVHGLAYGHLIDFIKIEKGSIKYLYSIQVHKKAAKYDEKAELKKLMCYGCQVMECVKRMSTAVFKCFTDMTGNRRVETECTKPNLHKKFT